MFALTSAADDPELLLILVLFIGASVTFMVLWSRERAEVDRALDESLARTARSVALQADYTKLHIFHLNGREWSATGFATTSGFVVQKGSIIRKEAFSSLTDKLHALRQSFVDSEILVDQPEGDELVLRTDFEFDSSTAAASFVTGRKASGPYNWKDEDGLTFGEYTKQNSLPA